MSVVIPDVVFNLVNMALPNVPTLPTSPQSSRDSIKKAARRVSHLLSPPQIPPRAPEQTLPGPNQVMYTDPLQATGTAVYSTQSPINGPMSQSTRRSRRSTVGSQQTEPSVDFILRGLTAPGPSSPLGVALTTRVGIVRTQKTSGAQGDIVTTATMEGLIHFLLRSVERDTRDHDIFFIAHPAFISPLDVLRRLFRQFEEAEEQPYDARHDIQTCVMHLINRWLRNQHVVFSVDDLSELNKFIIAVQELKGMDVLVREAMHGINEKELLLKPPPSSIIPSFNSATSTNPTARELAIALAIFEGEKYQRILPGEYMAHAGNCRLHSFSPYLTEAILLNERINNWVQSSILDMDIDIKTRCMTKTFFVQTAKACQDICNFSSLGAIMRALQSNTIASLTLTHKRMLPKERDQYQELVNLLKSHPNYAKYRQALSKVESRSCIPWHVVHLGDIRDIMQKENDVDDQHDPPLINFEKWAHLKEKAMSALQYRGVPFTFDGRDSKVARAMVYLQKVLQNTRVGEDFSRELQKNSEKLAQNERILVARAHGDLEDATRRAGFG